MAIENSIGVRRHASSTREGRPAEPDNAQPRMKIEEGLARRGQAPQAGRSRSAEPAEPRLVWNE
jgi:hypothetical protein